MREGSRSGAYFESHSRFCKSRSVDGSVQTCRFCHTVLRSGKGCKERGTTNVPQRDDDKLCILGPIFDVIGDDGYIPKIERSVDLVHKVKRGRLYGNGQIKSTSEVSKACMTVDLTLKTWSANTRARELNVYGPQSTLSSRGTGRGHNAPFRRQRDLRCFSSSSWVASR